MPTPKKSTATEKKSPAAHQLGGQPESDQEAREAGASSATESKSSTSGDKSKGAKKTKSSS